MLRRPSRCLTPKAPAPATAIRIAVSDPLRSMVDCCTSSTGRSADLSGRAFRRKTGRFEETPDKRGSAGALQHEVAERRIGRGHVVEAIELLGIAPEGSAHD